MRSLARAVMERGAAGVMIAPVPSLRTASTMARMTFGVIWTDSVNG
jgi:hypothetical protein